MMETKKCSKCREYKTIDFFYVGKRISSYCKECTKTVNREKGKTKIKNTKKKQLEVTPFVSNMILNLNYGLVEYAFEEWQVNELKRRYKKEIEITYNGFNYEIRRV